MSSVMNLLVGYTKASAFFTLPSQAVYEAICDCGLKSKPRSSIPTNEVDGVKEDPGQP